MRRGRVRNAKCLSLLSKCYVPATHKWAICVALVNCRWQRRRGPSVGFRFTSHKPPVFHFVIHGIEPKAAELLV